MVASWGAQFLGFEGYEGMWNLMATFTWMDTLIFPPLVVSKLG